MLTDSDLACRAVCGGAALFSIEKILSLLFETMP